MNTRILHALKLTLLLLLAVTGSQRANGQAGTSVLITVSNMVQTAPNEFQYDVYCTNVGTTGLAIRGYSWGLNHTPGLENGGTITHTFVSRDASLSTLPSVTSGYTASSNHIRATTTNATAGNEVALSAGVPIRLGTMKLSTSAATWPANFNPWLPVAPLEPIQVTTVPGRTQCVTTMIITPPGSSFTINGINNGFSSGSLQALIANLVTGCSPSSPFILNATCTNTCSTVSVNACDSYTWATNSTNYTTSGTYVHTSLIGAGPCVSTDSLVLTINASTPTTVNLTDCDSYTWPLTGLTYTISGNYVASFTNAANCDSSTTLNLTINYSSRDTTTITNAGPYTWAVTGATYTASGFYDTTLLSALNCDSVKVLNLTIGAAFTMSLSIDQEISCFGFNDGMVTANVLPAGSTYTFSIDGGAFTNTTGIFSNLTPGTHTICASNGTSTICDTIVLIEPTAMSFVSITVDSTVSCLGNDGQITAVIQGGTTVIQQHDVIWTAVGNPTFFENQQASTSTISNLAPDTYNIMVMDDNGCMIVNSIALGLTPVVVVTASNTPILCAGGNSVISASATGGTTSIVNPMVITVNGAPLAASYSAGTYTVTATDNKGCTASSVLTITEPSATTTTVNVVDCDDYQWAANSVVYTASGSYTVTLQNSANCDSIVTLNLTINSSSINAVSTVVQCSPYTWPINGLTYNSSGTYTASFTNAANCDSSFTLQLTVNTPINTVTSVTASNTYTWPVNGLTYTNSGVYTHTVFNPVTLCTNTFTLNLTVNTVSFGLNLVLDQPISCNGNNDGSIQATGIGTGPFTYILDGGAAVNFTGFFNNLGPGTHTVCALVGLAIACDTITLVQPDPLAATFNLISPVSCQGNDGEVEINITGGTNLLQGYLTWWINAAGDTLNDVLTNNFALDLDSLPVGPLSVVIEDDRGCFFTANTIVTAAPPIVVTATVNPTPCFGNTTPIFVTANGGVPTLPLAITINGTPALASYGPGTYTIVATDAKACTGSTVITINGPSAPIATSISQTECGSYTWAANNTTYTNSGIYTATLTTANLCDSVVTLTLTINPLPQVTANGPATACEGTLITLNGGGATSYVWSPVVPNGTPFVINATTTYIVTGTDALGCTATSAWTVNVTNTGGRLVNTTAGNATSVSGSACDVQVQPDGSTLSYHDVNCDLIVTIADPVGGNLLGNVNACNIVLPNVPVYNSQPYLARYYTISASTGPADITFYLTNDDFNDYNLNSGSFPQIPVPANPMNGDVTTLAVSRVPQTTLPGAPGAQTTVTIVNAVWNGAANRWEINLPVTGFGGFYFHAINPNNIPLPATVTRFAGYKGNAKDILEWTTSSEQFNDYFILDYSTDGINFNQLTTVNSKAPGGNSSMNLHYSAENLKPAMGHNYYRLQQVDLNGTKSYQSQIVDLIWNGDGHTVTIYPNPTSNVLHVDLYTTDAVNAVVKIMDMSGRTVKSIMARTEAGLNNLTISMTELASGLYTVQISENGVQTFVEKVRKND
jgi:hypothetical protein